MIEDGPAQAEGQVEDVEDVIKEALAPLVKQVAVLEGEIADLELQAKDKRETRKRLRKLLIDGGVLERGEPASGRPPTSSENQVASLLPSSVDKGRAALREHFEIGEEFTVRQFTERTDYRSRHRAGLVLKALYAEGEIRKASHRSPDDNGSGAGMRALHYARVQVND